jgi:hypothetical protein
MQGAAGAKEIALRCAGPFDHTFGIWVPRAPITASEVHSFIDLFWFQSIISCDDNVCL